MSKDDENKNPDFILSKADLKRALNYVDKKWEKLERYNPDDKGTLIGLPYPYIVPSVRTGSGFTFDEMYYWDSYFIAQGLLKSGREELAAGMLENLLYMAKRFDIVPNGNRFYFTGRSQPPLLTSYIFDVYERSKDLAWLQESMVIAEYEYSHVWMGSEQPNWRNVFHGLSRYYDINVIDGLAEAESGWDMTTRFGDKCLSFIPIDLNALLYKYENDLAKSYGLLGDETSKKAWEKRAKQRKETVNKYLWDPKSKFFFDYDYTKGTHSDVWSLAAYYTLWSGMASKRQAEHLAHHLEKFIADGGLTATLRNSKHEKHEKFHHQWAYPNGWAPLHWIVVKGLQNYGFDDLADRIAMKWLTTNTSYFKQHGIFREAYNVVTPGVSPHAGLYPPQIGFGWTNGVFVDFAINHTQSGKDWRDENIKKPSIPKRVVRKVKKILNRKVNI